MKKSLFITFLVVISLSMTARSGFWNDRPESSFESKGKRSWLPLTYRTFKIDLVTLKAELAAVPLESHTSLRQSASTITLPTPEGKEMTFNLVESPVMAPELANAFPSIKTYLGESTEDARISARIDITPFGFHAMVFSTEGIYFVDPYVFGNTSEYITYYKKDITILPSMTCGNDDESAELLNGEPSLVTPQNYSAQRSIGMELRTYRLALACTGEYAQFFGGTVSGALAAMVTSINRCNGVFERELDLRFVLVANDTLLIYLNPGNDPYTNNSGGTMLGENQSNINTVIGSSNYDIGHVFSTGGGGVAFKGSVCNNTNKARGVTGSPAPLSDPFDIDYVAHEMGHQFGGDHTFNATTGSCGGNRVSSAAYEPGSASTIMGYAGICTTNDLQPNSDPYYHTYSFDQIVNYMYNGTGNSCAARSTTLNQAPVVSYIGNFIIPYQTPFHLTASAFDPDGDPITYCWEEMDRGQSANLTPGPTSGDAPIFRSLIPDVSPKRFFPKYSSVLNNTSIKGESKPSYARTLHFRCTARDNKAGGGGVSYNDTLVNVEVINTGSGFAVTYPNAAGISWPEGSTQTITWNVAQSDVAPINTPLVNIYLSTDNGQTFPVVLGSNVANNGSYTFTVPNQLTSTARIWIEGSGNIFYDVNNVEFTITFNTAALDLDAEALVAVYPNPGTGIFEVTLPQQANKELKLDVYNQLGMQVYTTSMKANATKTSVDLSNLANGVYQFLFTRDGVHANKKIILLR